MHNLSTSHYKRSLRRKQSIFTVGMGAGDSIMTYMVSRDQRTKTRPFTDMLSRIECMGSCCAVGSMESLYNRWLSLVGSWMPNACRMSSFGEAWRPIRDSIQSDGIMQSDRMLYRFESFRYGHHQPFMHMLKSIFNNQLTVIVYIALAVLLYICVHSTALYAWHRGNVIAPQTS
jgi:hypothetical protein